MYLLARSRDEAADGALAATLRVHVALLDGKSPKMPSVVSLFPAAAWPEREIAEMYGIVFKEHPDPRKLLLPDNFAGHPMRRDYPAGGRDERDAFAVVRRNPQEEA